MSTFCECITSTEFYFIQKKFLREPEKFMTRDCHDGWSSEVVGCAVFIVCRIFTIRRFGDYSNFFPVSFSRLLLYTFLCTYIHRRDNSCIYHLTIHVNIMSYAHIWMHDCWRRLFMRHQLFCLNTWLPVFFLQLEYF